MSFVAPQYFCFHNDRGNNWLRWSITQNESTRVGDRTQVVGSGKRVGRRASGNDRVHHTHAKSGHGLPFPRQETLHPRGGTPANNPLACFVGVSGRERTPLPRHQETKETTKELRRVSHPFHVSDHRGAFPVAEVAEADLRIFPDRAGIESAVIRRDLTLDPHLFVPTQFVFDVRYQHRFVISLRHMPMARNRYDVVGKVLQRLDHDVLLNRRVVIVSSPSVLV
jgi:hypothetical protein